MSFLAGMIISCFATETIVKMRVHSMPAHSERNGKYGSTMVPESFSLSHQAGGRGAYNATFAAANTFTVYTSAEVDGLVQSLSDKLLREQKEQVTNLKANIKALSDANDALTARINDLEKTVNNK